MLKPGIQRTPRFPRRAAAMLCLSSWLVTSGCFFGKKKTARVFTPPPPVAAQLPPTPTPIDIFADPPLVETEISTPSAPISAEITLPPAPVPVAPKPPAAKPQAPAVIVETPATPPLPAKPVSILSASEQQQLVQQYDGHMDRARKALARADGRNLTRDLEELARLAKNNLMVAEQERTRDLRTAVSFAERAERFATDLQARLP